MSYASNPARMIYRFLDTNGDGSGSKDHIGDMTATDIKFTADVDTVITRLIIYIEDGTGFKADLYGLLTALPNGWSLKVQDELDADVIDLTDGVVVKTNSRIGAFCFDVDVKSWGVGAGDEGLVARWTFEKAGSPLFIPAGYSLVIEFNDNFTGLIHHTFQAQGYTVSDRTPTL